MKMKTKHILWTKDYFKDAVSVISSDPSCKDLQRCTLKTFVSMIKFELKLPAPARVSLNCLISFLRIFCKSALRVSCWKERLDKLLVISSQGNKDFSHIFIRIKVSCVRI